MRTICWVLAIAAAGLGCGHFGGGVRGGGGPTLQSLAQSLGAPQGFVAAKAPGFFNRENLFEAIDGMAPEYISYGCNALAVLQWKPSGAKSEEPLEAQIYDMGGALGAFGIYSRTHVGGKGEFADVGEEAAVAEDAVEFARNQYYVRLSGPPESRPALENLARTVVAKIPPGPKTGTLVAGLPAEGRVPRSERWIPDAAFGMEFMRNVFVARYKMGDQEAEVYSAAFSGPAEAAAAWAKFRTAIQARSPETAAESVPGFAYSDEWMGRIGVFQVGRRVIVMVGYAKSAAATALLRKIADAKA